MGLLWCPHVSEWRPDCIYIYFPVPSGLFYTYDLLPHSVTPKATQQMVIAIFTFIDQASAMALTRAVWIWNHAWMQNAVPSVAAERAHNHFSSFKRRGIGGNSNQLSLENASSCKTGIDPCVCRFAENLFSFPFLWKRTRKRLNW